jgi:hypothetical protein
MLCGMAYETSYTHYVGFCIPMLSYIWILDGHSYIGENMIRVPLGGHVCLIWLVWLWRYYVCCCLAFQETSITLEMIFHFL